MNSHLEEALFALAVRKPQEERAAFLERECGGDSALRQRIEQLLATHEGSGPSLEQPTAPSGATTAMLPPEEGPGTVISRYKILEKIGEGGFGAVYVAEQREPVKRRVALKIIKLGMDTRQVVARFEAERQALALMDHPNIAKVLDAGATETGRPFFAMELVKGIPITHYCDQEKLGTRERLNLFIQLCHAIQHAHQKGIIHRDIKPSNILVTLHDGVPLPKVIDFGIAKATQQELTEKTVYTQFQQFIGTPAYMSPEQAEMSGLDIDTRSDIYSLGVLLYELLTGSTPFDTQELLKSGLEEMRKIIREREPMRPSTRLRDTTFPTRSSSPLSTLHSALSTDLDWIVMKCLEKDRTRRYDTANAVAMDIERHLRHEPVVARPPSLGYRLQKSFRRNRLVFTAAGVVALALMLGVLVSTSQAVRATKARREETAARRRADAASEVANDQKQRAEQSELLARQSLYGAEMSLAYRARQENNLGLALELLNKHRPAAGQPDVRGWEWRYLWGACQSDERDHFASLSDGVVEVAVSPDGRLLAAAGNYFDGRGGVSLWEIASKKLIATPDESDASGSVAFSPNGKWLAFGTVHHGIKLWDLAENKEAHEFPGKQLGWPARGVVFSSDESALAAYQGAGEIVLWNLGNYSPIKTFKGPLRGTSSLTFSPDGHTLLSSSWDWTIRLWSVETGQQLHCFTNSARVNQVALSPDGKILASADLDGKARIWDLQEKRLIKELTNHWFVFSVAFSPDGKTLASGSSDYTIRLWDTATWEEISTLRGSLHEIWCLAFLPYGKTLFSGAKDGVIKVWDATPKRRKSVLRSRSEDADALEIFPGGITLVSHTNNTYTLWEAGTLRTLGPYAKPPIEMLTNAVATALSPTGDRLALATRQGGIVLWDLPGQHQVTNLTWFQTEDRHSPRWMYPGTPAGAISPDGKRLCFIAANRLTVWDLETFEEVATLPKSPVPPLPRAMCFSDDGRSIAIGNEDCTVEVWDLARKRRVGPWKAHREAISQVAFMPGGDGLLTASFDTTIKLWNIKTQKETRCFGRTENAYLSVAVAPGGKRVAGASGLNTYIRIWNAETGQELARLDGVANYLTFLADGNTLVSGTDQGIRLWRAPSWAEIEAAEARDRKEAQAQ